MKTIKGAVWSLFLAASLFFPQAIFASDHIADDQASALDAAGVPVYPGATFMTADESNGMALWFNSSDSPDAIMDWYEEQLPEWTATTVNTMRVIYNGPAGAGQEKIMAVPHLYVMTGEQLGRGPDHGNEITINIPASP